MQNGQLEGLVLKNYSGFYYVQDQNQAIYECKTRGKLKEKILTGDRVIITDLGDGTGIMEERLPRVSELYRPKIANVSMVLIVLAYDRPKPDLTLLDRLLFLTQFSGLLPIIVLNKCDLEEDPRIAQIEQYYPHAGYKVVKTSTKKGIGQELLKELIKDQIAVMAGPSGSGKSSLLNSLSGQVPVRTQEVSNKIGRGRHTTRHVELYPLDNGGWLADTPGFSVLEMPQITRQEFTGYFPDFEQYTSDCRFANCIHYKEADCQVKRAVDNGEIAASRYQHYRSMLEEIIENERCY